MEKEILDLICRELQIEIMKFFLKTSVPKILNKNIDIND